MSLPLLVQRKGLSLIPADRLSEEDMEALKVGPQYLVDVRKPRSLQHHRLLFSLLRKVAQSTPTPLSEDALLSWVKVRTGHVEYVPLGFGKSYEAPTSIAFSNMDQGEFNEFFRKVADLICCEVVPGLDNAALEAEIAVMLADKRAA